MRDARARQLLVAEARRLSLVQQAIGHDITAAQADSESRPASETRGPAAGASTLEHEVEVSLQLVVDDELAEVAFALARLDSGTFGTCVACGGAIPDARLEVVAATRFCVACEAIGERHDGAVHLPMIDTILRAALREVDGWADDGPDEDDVVVPAPEEAAMRSVRAIGSPNTGAQR